MKKLKPKQQIAAVVIGALIILVLFFLIGWRPQTGRIAKLKKEQSQLELELQKNRNTRAQYEALKTGAADVEGRLVEAANQMPDEPKLDALLKDLQDVANEAGLDFTDIKVEEEMVDGDGFRIIGLDVEVAGTYFDMVDYLYRLANLSREFKVIEVTIEDDESWPQLNISIKAEVYIYDPDAKPEKEAGKANKAIEGVKANPS